MQYRTVPLQWNTRVLVIGTRDAASCLMGCWSSHFHATVIHTVLELHHNTSSRHYYRYVAPAENIERSLLIEFCGLLVPVYLVAYFNTRVHGEGLYDASSLASGV